jgi:hypothetical protein
MSAKEQLENFSIYSNKFFHNFHLSESSFTCPGLHTSGLAWRLREEWYRLRQVSRLISGVIISLYLRTVQQCRLNAWACWAVAWGPMYFSADISWQFCSTGSWKGLLWLVYFRSLHIWKNYHINAKYLINKMK